MWGVWERDLIDYVLTDRISNALRKLLDAAEIRVNFDKKQKLQQKSK